MRRILWAISLGIFIVYGGLAYSQSSPNYRIEMDVISGGDGDGISTNYELMSTLGQPSIIGFSSSSSYKDYGGFWHAMYGGAISPITPNEGTIGTEMTIKGSGFGTKRGRVLLGSVALKVVTWGDTTIVAQINKPFSPGTYDITIQPKGVFPIVYEDGFSVEMPEILSVDPSHGAVGDKSTMGGNFFGTKKGKVYIGGKTSKVISWMMDKTTGEGEIIFEVPKRLVSGTYDLTITNQIGSDVMSGGFRID